MTDAENTHSTPHDPTPTEADHAKMQAYTEVLEDFFENGVVGLHIVGSDGLIRRANKAELCLLGYNAGEYIGHHIGEFHADPPVIEDILARLTRGQKLDREPARLRAKDGSIRHVLISSSAQFRDGEFLNTRCFTVDVTASKQAEDRVRAAEHRYLRTLEALPVAVYTTDPAGRITFFNRAAVDLAGRKPELGIDLWSINPRMLRTDGTPWPPDECPMAIALKEQKPVHGHEAIAERPDGSRVRFAAYPTPIFDEYGSLTGAVNMLQDITDRYRAEAESSRLGAIVDSSDDAIISKTLDGTITSWNAAATRIFGYAAAEMIGSPITRLIPPEMHAEERVILSKLKRGERIEHYETVRVAKDGRLVDVSLTVSPIRDRSGALVGASKVSRDITQRKHTDKLQRQLLSELNHRIKNTLATVQAITTQSLRTASSPKDFAVNFSGRLQGLARAHALLTDTFWQGTDLMALVRDQVLMDAEDDARISFSGPDVSLEPQAALHLASIFHELVVNAQRHGSLTVPTGRVAVSWQAVTADHHLLLQWAERGGPSAASPAFPGFGLSLIERTLAAHGGKAAVRYGREGLTCDISLPLPQERRERGAYRSFGTPSTEPAAAASKRGLQSGRNKRVLVVEDEPLVAIEMTDLLTEAGYRVVGPAASIERAMSLIENESMDAALLDANLGGHRVDPLAAALAERHIPFVFVTGYGRDGLPIAFRDAPVLGKPFKAAEVLRHLETLLSATDAAKPAEAPPQQK